MPTSKKSSTIKRSIDRKQTKQIKNLQRAVRRIDQLDEKKWIDTPSVSYSISTTGVVVNLTQLDVWAGTNVNRHRAREGNSILMTDTRLKGLVVIPPPSVVNVSDEHNRVRCIIVRMNDTPSIPVISDILHANNINSFYRIKGTLKYTVMFDKTYNLTNLYQVSSGTTSAVGSSYEPWRIPFLVNLKKKLGKNGTKVQYAQGSGTGANPVDNGMYMLLLSDSGALAHPMVRYSMRQRFLDN